MGKIKSVKIKFFISIIAGIIIGVIIGSSIIIALVSYRIDKYYEEIQKLNIAIEERDERLKKLEQSINSKKLILKDIEILLVHEGDDIDKITIEKYAEDKYHKLLGREVDTIDSDILEEIIDKRIFKVSNKEYRLKVIKIILTDILKIWIETELTK
jgi:septal ring factor EnvC (AmiA/AmiB activator)